MPSIFKISMYINEYIDEEDFLILDDKVLEGLGSKTLVELREIAKN